eukprot:TRINITY_DN20132_c0_g1_i1.p1 TRINITY_DN20132_c0_g1~~TRINITY_DN20132_c0_g1_i1.p1  ORF type:complete len:398 (-),score=121.51 TRINITY_DN20132_c0_g1_i1:40-1233(-)
MLKKLILVLLVLSALVPPLSLADHSADADDDSGYLEDADPDVSSEFDPDHFKTTFRKVEPSNMFTYDKFGLGDSDTPDNFIMEIFMGVFLAIYLVNFFIGKNQNNDIAAHWFNIIRPVLDAQFHEVGAYDPPQTEKMVKDSHNLFKVYASGRRYCAGILATLELRKRQDIFSLILAQFNMSVTHDTMTLDIPLDDDVADSILFAICKKRDERRMKRNNKDVEFLAVSSKSEILPRELIVLQDSIELEREILTNQLIQLISDNSHLILYIHITDCYLNTPSLGQKLLKCQFIVNSASRSDLERLQGLTTAACLLIDQAAKARLTPASKKLAQKKRDLLREQMLKATQEDRLERLREEKRRREEAAFENLSAAEKKRLEEKELKKSMKKRNSAKVRVLR